MGELRINVGNGEAGESDKPTTPDEPSADLLDIKSKESGKLVGRMGDKEFESEAPPLAFNKLIEKNTGEVLGTIESIEPNGRVFAIKYTDLQNNIVKGTLTQAQFDGQIRLNQDQPK